MKTIELMSTDPRVVRADERLDAAARAMWETDCGLVPVVDDEGELVGVVTDRDLCMASLMQGRPLAEIPIDRVMSRRLRLCRSDDPVEEVMHRMQELRVHRLPVVDAAGRLTGIVSTNDLVRAAHARPAAVDPVAVVRTLATIGEPRRVTEFAPASASGSAESPQAPLPGAAAAPPKRRVAAKKAGAGRSTGTKTTKKKAAKKKAAKGSSAAARTKGRSATGRRRKA